MSDLISRQQAIDSLDFEIVHMTAYCDGKNEGNPLAQYNKGLEDGKKAIEALPSAQPEIIRCKDCKHYKITDNRAFGFPVKVCKWTGFEDVDDDDFCSRAERRTDGSD